MLVNQLFLTQAFLMLTDAADVSENSEAFVCSVRETSGKGTLHSSAYNDKLLFLQASYRSWKTWKSWNLLFKFAGLESHKSFSKIMCSEKDIVKTEK